MSYVPHPVEIEYKSADDALHMVFSDDHVAVYPTPYLRGYCPCARCQGHSGGAPRWQPLTSRRQIEVVDVEPVGNYALAITWGDGHDTGIYAFRSLRDRCPCPKCRPQGLEEKERSFVEGA